MDNTWVKAIVAIVLAAGIIVGINKFRGPKRERPAVKPEKTVGQVWREDEKRLRAEPNVPPEKPIKFRELEEEEQAGAEQLFEMAMAQRKMARLPGVGYREMVDYCRLIIERYPGSEFEYKARRMLGEVPRDEWERFKITEKEINGFPPSRE